MKCPVCNNKLRPGMLRCDFCTYVVGESEPCDPSGSLAGSTATFKCGLYGIEFNVFVPRGWLGTCNDGETVDAMNEEG